jgi:hypothetical protein
MYCQVLLGQSFAGFMATLVARSVGLSFLSSPLQLSRLYFPKNQPYILEIIRTIGSAEQDTAKGVSNASSP